MKIKSIVMTLIVLCATFLQVGVANAFNATTQIDIQNTENHHMQNMPMSEKHNCCDSDDEAMLTMNHDEECLSHNDCMSHCSFNIFLTAHNLLNLHEVYTWITFHDLFNKPTPTVSFILRPPKYLA